MSIGLASRADTELLHLSAEHTRRLGGGRETVAAQMVALPSGIGRQVRGNFHVFVRAIGDFGTENCTSYMFTGIP